MANKPTIEEIKLNLLFRACQETDKIMKQQQQSEEKSTE
jgi:hypothetical protein